MEFTKKLRSYGWLGAILLATLGATPAVAEGNGGESGGSTFGFTPQTGFWSAPGETGGRGVIIERNADGNFFAATLVFDQSGRALWYVVDTNTATDGNQAGLMQQFVGGQNLEGEYRQGTFLGFTGIAYFTFDTPTSGKLIWPGGEMLLQRYDIIANGVASGPAAGAPRSGWWYNAAEGGRGYFMEVQGDNMFFAALMYDDLGQATWYTARGSMVTPTFFQGGLGQPYGGATVSGEASAGNQQNYSMGNISIQFTDDNHATLTLHNGRQIQITRYSF